jgi:hypothetical protein
VSLLTLGQSASLSFPVISLAECFVKTICFYGIISSRFCFHRDLNPGYIDMI